jgi:hypothetical protein
MRWGRSSRRFGGYLALFALWLQFAVSFAHIHPADSIIDHGQAGVVAAPSPGAPGSPTTPSSNRTGDGRSHDECPICASIYLVSTAFLGEPPALVVPMLFYRADLPLIANGGFQVARYTFFQTRAPPIA